MNNAQYPDLYMIRKKRSLKPNSIHYTFDSATRLKDTLNMINGKEVYEVITWRAL